MQSALDKYLRTISILKKGYENEKHRVSAIGKSFLGDMYVSQVTSVDIANYRDMRLQHVNPKTNKTLSTSTVRLELSLLSSFYDIARIEWGISDKNPVSNVRKPKAAAGRDRRLTNREERLILRYAHNFSNKDLYAIIVIALETAMRQGEILALRWEHINLKSRIAHLPDTKNGTKRDVPLSNKAKDIFVKLGVKTSGRVFSYTSEGIKSTWRFMLIKLGIQNLHFHDLRHEAVSRLFEIGTLDMMEVAHISGHKSLSMLKRYTHLKSARLVSKLEGNRNKGRQAILDYLVPYPAVCLNEDKGYTLKVLDFDDLVINGTCHNQVLREGQDALLRRILNLIKNSQPIIEPDQYLEMVDENSIFMLDPLASEFTEELH